MKKKYEGNARVKGSILQALRKEFETLKMNMVRMLMTIFLELCLLQIELECMGNKC